MQTIPVAQYVPLRSLSTVHADLKRADTQTPTR